MIDLGTVKPGSTIRIPFSSFDKDDGSSITMTNYAAADILVYKDGSTTERASTAGFTATTDFDGKTGKHLAIIDLADNTTAGFFSAGSEYLVAIDAVTVDAVTTGGWIARFRIGAPNAILDTTIATLASQTSFTLTAGPAEDDALNGCLVYIHDVASGVQSGYALVADYTGSTKTVTLAAGATYTVATTDNISFFPPNTLFSGTGAVTLPTSVASPTNITAGTITTVTTLTNAPGDSAGVTTLLSRLPSGLFTGLTNFAHWLGAIAGKQAANSTAQTEIRASGAGSGTFDPTTDSQEAIRDNMGTAQTGDSYARIGAPAGASVSADVAAVKTDTGNLVTRIPSALFSGITSLAQWLGLMAGKQVGNSTARTEIRATGAGSGTYDETTDSQEATQDDGAQLRDFGIMQVTTIATLASQTSFTLTAGSADNNTYIGAKVMITDATTEEQKATGVISAYTGSTKTVTLQEDPGIFTMAVGDNVTIQAPAHDIFKRRVDGTVTFEQGQRLQNSAAGAKLSGAATTTVVVRDLADSKDRVSATVDANGNRTAVTRDLT